MPTYAFTGSYETNVELPDSTVVLAEPGSVHDLPFDDPGPLWKPATSDDPIPAPTLAVHTPIAPADDEAEPATPTPATDTSPAVPPPAGDTTTDTAPEA